jgi:hypothetical protein
MSTTWQCWAKRSTSATMQAAPGNTVPHCLNERLVVLLEFGRVELRLDRIARRDVRDRHPSWRLGSNVNAHGRLPRVRVPWGR